MQKTTKTSKETKKQSQRPTLKPKNCHKLPKQISEKEFNNFFLPYLSLPKQSRKPVIPYMAYFQLHSLSNGHWLSMG